MEPIEIAMALMLTLAVVGWILKKEKEKETKGE